MIETVEVEFDGSSSTETATWTDRDGLPFGYAHGVEIIDAAGDIGVWLTSVTDTGATVNATDTFEGTVVITVYPVPT